MSAHIKRTWTEKTGNNLLVLVRASILRSRDGIDLGLFYLERAPSATAPSCQPLLVLFSLRNQFQLIADLKIRIENINKNKC